MTRARRFRGWATFAALLLLGASLAQPTLSLPRGFFRYVLVFDITQSMNVADQGTAAAPLTRLAAAKHTARRMLDRLPCDSEIGLALFTEHRSLLLFAPVEVCAHYTEINAVLNTIDWRLAWRSRSEIAKGLISAIDLNAKLARPGRVVLFTDGHEAPPIHPEFRQHPTPVVANQRGVIVGIGGDDPRPIPKFDHNGLPIGFWQPEDLEQVDVFSRGRDLTGEAMTGVDMSDLAARIQRGTEHLSALHEDYLRALAREAGFAYHRLRDPDDAARYLRRAEFAERRTAATDLGPYLAGAAMLLLLASYAAPLARFATPRVVRNAARAVEHPARDTPNGKGA
ncbi:MAG: vWA domain-containing protein [Thiotrichales bacterium]